GACGNAHALGDAMAGGDDHVVPREVEGLDRAREERQVPAVRSRHSRHALEERDLDPSLLDRRRDGAAPPDQRVDRCAGKEAAEALEQPLASAHAREPVVNESDSQAAVGRRSRTKKTPRPPRSRSRYPSDAAEPQEEPRYKGVFGVLKKGI